MQFSELASQAVPVVLVILIIIAAVAVVEVILTLRRVRTTLDGVDETIKKADPILERAQLTVDSVNLELLRIDHILEDVEGATSKAGDAATGAAQIVSTVSNMPRDLASSLTDFVRGGAGKALRQRRAEKSFEAEGKRNAALEAPENQHTQIEASVAGEAVADVAEAAADAVKQGATAAQETVQEVAQEAKEAAAEKLEKAKEQAEALKKAAEAEHQALEEEMRQLEEQEAALKQAAAKAARQSRKAERAKAASAGVMVIEQPVASKKTSDTVPSKKGADDVSDAG